jgi:hypothetical protein
VLPTTATCKQHSIAAVCRPAAVRSEYGFAYGLGMFISPVRYTQSTVAQHKVLLCPHHKLQAPT